MTGLNASVLRVLKAKWMYFHFKTHPLNNAHSTSETLKEGFLSLHYLPFKLCQGFLDALQSFSSNGTSEISIQMEAYAK